MQFAEAQLESMPYRLGNLTLLASAVNRNLGNTSCAEKRKIYRDSECEIPRQLAVDDAERIAARQNQMARLATAL